MDLDGDGDVNDGKSAAGASRDSSPSTPLMSKLLTFDKIIDKDDKRQVG